MTIPAFPSLPAVTYPIKRSPRWLVLHQEGLGGLVTALSEYNYPLWSYEIDITALRDYGSYTERQALMGLFNQCGGSAGYFTFSDTTDNTATAQSIGTGDGTTTTFQLVRTLGGFTEPVFAPATITDVTVGGVATGAYTLGSYGQITFATAPALGASIAWDGAYDWLCRFDDDTLAIQQDMSGFWSVKSLKFSTVIPP